MSVGNARKWLRRSLPVAVLVLLKASPVLGLDYELAGRASVGVTDNALAAPEGTPGSGPDALLTLRGEAAMVWLRKYMEHKLGYLIGLDTYLRSSGGETLTNALRWQAAYEPLRWLHLATDFTATEGTLSSVDTVTTLGRAGIFSVPSGPRPAAPLRYLTLDGRQGATFTLSPDWRLSKACRARPSGHWRAVRGGPPAKPVMPRWDWNAASNAAACPCRAMAQ